MNTKPARAFSSITPDYKEPTSADQFAAQAEAVFTPGQPVDHDRVRKSMASMVTRIRQLEAALLPFAVVGMNVAQARMVLNASNKAKVPAGGTWISTVDSISCTAGEGLFYDAIDASGRTRVELHMQAEFARLQKAMTAQDERDDHVDAGGSTH